LPRGRSDSAPIFADAGAKYRDRIVIDLAALSPMVAAPPSPGSGAPVESFVGQKVDQVYVGNCSNGTLTDLRQVAEILRGRTVAPHVRMVVVPATQAIWRAALAEGLLDIFTAAGAVVSPPTCGACFGGHMGILAAGETAVATTNRNFRGRMGHPESRVYLANAWVAAASAVRGEITPPQALLPAAGGRS
jgi:3-isopropylmalate/(R)-2-methylmalate dehydratase large subunit